MGAIARILALVVIVLVAVSMRYGSNLMTGQDLSISLGVIWSVAPLCAGISCILAASVSRGTERRAWKLFSMGSLLWLAGMLVWTGYNLRGVDAPSPGLPDAGYLLGALSFIPAMFFYVIRGGADRRIERWNFVLVASGAALSIFALSLPQITTSHLSIAGTALALAYPAIWAGAAGTGLVHLIFYVSPQRRIELLIVIAALLIQAWADLLYGLSLMGGSYAVGSYLDGSWLAAFSLLVWAGIERRLRGYDAGMEHGAGTSSERHPAEAFFAAAIVAAVSVAVSVVGALLGKSVALLSIPIVLLYSFAIGAREYLSLASERRLRHAAERTLKQLTESQKRLSSVLESTTDSVVVLDRDWRLTYFNSRAMETVGGERKLEIGRSLWELFPEEVGSTFDRMYRKAMNDQQPVSLEEYLPTLGAWLEVHAFPSPDGISIFFRDISARRQAQDRITQLAYHDPLTGLGNRTLFQKSLEHSLSDLQGGVALMCLDLDHFKEVNDSFGHNIGDLLLKQVASRLVEVVDHDVTLARLGGDEFAIVVPAESNPAALTKLAERIIAALARPYQIDAITITIGGSIGVAIFPLHAERTEELFSDADTALYFAKAGGRGRALMFQPEMTEQVRWKQALRADLAEAADLRQFHLHYQPIVDLASNQVCDFEALIRWHHPQRGDVPPSVFVPVAEESGLIDKIGDWVLEQACGQAATWPPNVGVSVNLSASQLRDDGLSERIGEILKTTALSANRLSIEITESILLDHEDNSTRMLAALRNLGVRIALDDFGTGYSSLSYLRTFPFDKIKIDRSFIVDLENPTSIAIIRAVVDIGKALGSTVIAEGVETRQQLDHVRKEGCGQAQGYFFSRPVPAGAVVSASQRIEKASIWWTDKNRSA